MSELISTEALSAFFQVIFIDLVLAGDNAIVIGLRRRACRRAAHQGVLVGIIAATVLRIIFASVTTWLLAIVGLLVAGGILLLWVCWKMWRELRTHEEAQAAPEALADDDLDRRAGSPRRAAQDLRPGRAADHHRRCLDVARQRARGGRCRARQPVVLIFGLALSVALMGAAAS